MVVDISTVPTIFEDLDIEIEYAEISNIVDLLEV